MYEYRAGEKFPIQFVYQGKKSEGIAEMGEKEGVEQEQNPEEVPPKDKVDIPISQVFREDDNSKGISGSEFIPGGSFLVARKIFHSKIWLKHPFYLKIWLWIFGQASHKDYSKDGRTYRRGELITTYDEIIKGAAYYFNKQHIVPTLKQVRIILQWLEVEGMIVVEPIKANDAIQRLTRADPRAETRAYIGIRIMVVNYDTYQDLENYKGRHQGRPSVPQGHNNNNGTRMGKEIYAQNFLSFWKEYPHKVAKKIAYKAWQKLEKTEDMKSLLSILLNAIEKQKQAKGQAKAKGEFVPEWPHGATWLNGRRWEDEVDVKKRWDHAG